MKTLLLSGMVLVLLAGCAGTQAKSTEWTLVDGSWVSSQPVVVAEEPWYRWLYCGAFASTPCQGEKPMWAKGLDLLSVLGDAYTGAGSPRSRNDLVPMK